MSQEIINRVAKSSLVTIDLEDYYPEGKRTLIDIKNWLFKELVLKEKDFRNDLKKHDWSQYQNQYIAITCSVDAIIPSWAYLLVATYLTSFAKKVVVGDLKTLENAIFYEIIGQIDIKPFQDRPVVIKGCSDKAIPPTAYIQLINKLQPVVKSIMYGEACSTVPLYKSK